MNDKQAKFLRQLVRWEGKDPREDVGQPLVPMDGMAWDVKHQRFGIPYVQFSGQRRLAIDCGRAIYRQYKRGQRGQYKG